MLANTCQLCFFNRQVGPSRAPHKQKISHVCAHRYGLCAAFNSRQTFCGRKGQLNRLVDSLVHACMRLFETNEGFILVDGLHG